MDKILFLFGLLLISSLQLQGQSEDRFPRSLPSNDGPVQVEIGYAITNITDINEKEETIDYDGAIIMRWSDERLAYSMD